MSMTKKERAALDAAIHRAEKLAALRWTSPISRDVLPENGASYVSGWDFNVHTREVFEAWTGVVSHGRGAAPQKHISGTQGPKALFSTKGKAIAALRNAVEHSAADILLAIDKMFEA